MAENFLAYDNQAGGGIIYVVGHRHPDTDSIVSAIAYAHLRQKQGYNVVACRLGDLTQESSYVLQRFGVDPPLYMADARSQLDETEIDEANALPQDAIVRDAIEKIDESHKVFTVQDEQSKLMGLVTNSSIAKAVFGDTAASIDLLAQTSVENITKAIDGSLLYSPEKASHNGKVSTIALSANRLKFYDLDKRIVILGNDTNAQLDAIAQGASILILVWTKEVAPMVIAEAKKNKCAIILSGYGAMNTSRYIYYAIPLTLVMTPRSELVVFNVAEFVDDAKNVMMRTRHRAYPVTDEENRVLGFTSRYRLLNAAKRRFVLVDHNEPQQSVPHITSAELIEIIDHHRIGDITSDRPITFRNETVGATATILCKMFRESNIEPDDPIKGLLLSAIIADTLHFKSPTTTDQDRAIAEALAADLDITIEELAEGIFTASSQQILNDLSVLLEADVKEYEVGERKVLISQYTMYRLNQTAAIQSELLKVMEKKAEEVGAYLWLMMFTSARDNGSIFYAAGPGKDCLTDIFANKDGELASFQPGIVSRKNQVLPQIILHLRESAY